MLCTREITVRLPGGLRHQDATHFIQTANSFDSVIRLTCGGNSVNAKSLLGLVSLNIGPGMKILLSAEGKDAEAAVDALERCLAGA